MEPIVRTIQREQAADNIWDAIVIGAGVGGSIAAIEIAAAGRSVLLVEKESFPRDKVCGCCLNLSALKELSKAGLDDVLTNAGGIKLTELLLSVSRKQALIALPEGLAISRASLDGSLVNHGISLGAQFLPSVRASVDAVDQQCRQVALEDDLGKSVASARMVVVADGIGGQALKQAPGFQSSVAPHSRIGVGVTLSDSPHDFTSGRIYMAVSKGGYAGAVVLPQGRLDIAACLDVEFLRESDGPGRAVQSLFQQAGFPHAELEHLPWKGTHPLTRQRRMVADDRLIVCGDSALYIEPFTGEGMAWALRSGRAAALLVVKALAADGSGTDGSSYPIESAWTRIHSRLIGARTLPIKLMSQVLRHPEPVSRFLPLLRQRWIASPILNYINS